MVERVSAEVPERLLQVEPVEFSLGGYSLSGERWGCRDGLPVLALHGWLDNAGSFNFIAPKLPHLDLVCLDLAGHGESDWRPSMGAYNIWQDVVEVLYVVKQLGWKRFALLGHSRGAMVATLMAGAVPQRISHLGLIEAFVPPAVPESLAPEQLGKAFEGVLTAKEKVRNYYPNYKAAVKARARGFMPVPMMDASALARRSVRSDVNGFYWANDPLLVGPSEMKLSEAQIRAFVEKIEAPIQLVIGDQGIVPAMTDLAYWKEHCDNLTLSELPGGHHLHMSTQADAVAGILSRFYADG